MRKFCSFFNIITYLLLNSDYGIGCVYSPLGVVIFVAVERTFVCFIKGHDHFISNSIRCGCLRTDQCNIACPKAAVNRNALAIDRRPPPKRRRTVPCDLRRASLPVLPLFVILFLDTLCSKKWYDMPHIGCGIHSLQWSTIHRFGRHSAGYS